MSPDAKQKVSLNRAFNTAILKYSERPTTPALREIENQLLPVIDSRLGKYTAVSKLG